MTWDQVLELIKNILFTQTGVPHLFGIQGAKALLMIAISFFFLYLAVAKE